MYWYWYADMNYRNADPQNYILNMIFCFCWIWALFQTSTALFKIAGLKIKKLFAETSLRLSFTDFYKAKIAEVINLFTVSDNKIPVGGLFLCRPSYLTICLCSPNHCDLKVQFHELEIFIWYILWWRMIIHFSCF